MNYSLFVLFSFKDLHIVFDELKYKVLPLKQNQKPLTNDS